MFLSVDEVSGVWEWRAFFSSYDLTVTELRMRIIPRLHQLHCEYDFLLEIEGILMAAMYDRLNAYS